MKDKQIEIHKSLHAGWVVTQFIPRRRGHGKGVYQCRTGYLLETYARDFSKDEELETERVITTTATMASMPQGGSIGAYETYGYSIALYEHGEANVRGTKRLMESCHAKGLMQFRRKLGDLKRITEQLEPEVEAL